MSTIIDATGRIHEVGDLDLARSLVAQWPELADLPMPLTILYVLPSGQSGEAEGVRMSQAVDGTQQEFGGRWASGPLRAELPTILLTPYRGPDPRSGSGDGRGGNARDRRRARRAGRRPSRA